MPPKITLSRGLLRRMRLTETLNQVFGAISPEIARRRAELLTPDLRPGETMPDAELEHELYLRLLDRRLDEAVKAEKPYRLAAIRFKSLSRERDQTTAELTDQLGAVRQMVDLALGKGTSADLLAVKGRTQRRQGGVWSQAGDLVVRLDELARLYELKPRESKRAGVSADPEVWKGMIEPGYRQLNALRKQVTRQQKVLDGLLISKDKAFAAFDDTARGLVRLAEGQCRMVGRLDLAKRVRQFSRKRKKPGPKPQKKAKPRKKAKKAAKASPSKKSSSRKPREPEEPARKRRMTPNVA